MAPQTNIDAIRGEKNGYRSRNLPISFQHRKHFGIMLRKVEKSIIFCWIFTPKGQKFNLQKWVDMGSCHKRQKPQAPTPQAPIRNRQTRKVQTPQVLTTIPTLPNLTKLNLT